MQIWASQALTDTGWCENVAISIDKGIITQIQANAPPVGYHAGIVLPAPANLHSHAFQRAMAGLTETRGPNEHDSFWTWRQLMYRFLDQLTPDDVESITAFAQMEMLEAGFARVGEFHYLHHLPDGTAYSDSAEMAVRIVAAAATTGIGLTLLPVLYQQANCTGAPLNAGQRRFGCNIDEFSRLFDGCRAAVQHLPNSGIGTAPHSLRAVTPDGLAAAITLGGDNPIHMHLAEQQAECDEILNAYGSRPGRWLFDNAAVGENWTLIHCTQLDKYEIATMAKTGATIGLCPVTEASLGDGIFDIPTLLANDGGFGIGTDSNIRIALAEELRGLEYSQRLRDKRRIIVSGDSPSVGRTLFDNTCRGGAKALAHGAGILGVGSPADILGLDETVADLAMYKGDQILDSFVFCGNNNFVKNLWVGGRHIVQQGQHFAHDSITASYHNVMKRLILDL